MAVVIYRFAALDLVAQTSQLPAQPSSIFDDRKNGIEQCVTRCIDFLFPTSFQLIHDQVSLKFGNQCVDLGKTLFCAYVPLTLS